jgi:uncharacterized membrane protein
MTGEHAPAAPVEFARDLTFGDLRLALAAGWDDFKSCPVYGLFFGSIYTAAGLFLSYAMYSWGVVTWLAALVSGFPFIAPVTAVGLYEVSRRREAGLAMSWKAVLTRCDEQIFSMAVIAFVAFGFWIMLAHAIFAIFHAQSGMGSVTLELFLSPSGIAMLLIGGAVGAAMALALYSITVISLPMLVDREVDFITAMITSVGTIRSNKPVMLVWAFLIAVLLFVAVLPLFLGLPIVLPVLGHATWHLYRRAVSVPAS